MPERKIEKRGRKSKKRQIEEESLDENQNNAKRVDTKIDVEENFEKLIKTGIDLFNNKISTATMSYQEILAYFEILKKLTTSNDWKHERIINNKEQMECLINEALETDEERKDLEKNIKAFLRFKLKCFPGQTMAVRAESIAKHYKSELKCNRVTVEGLREEIHKLTNSIQQAEGIEQPVKNEKRPKGGPIKIFNKYKLVCRLCGSKERLIYNINQKKDDGLLKDLVERFCRIKLRESDKLPQLVCKTCKDLISNFSKFTDKVSAFQNELHSLDLNSNDLIDPENIKKEIILDLDEIFEDGISNDSISINQSDIRITDIQEVDLNTTSDDSVEHCEIIDSTEVVVENLLREMENEIDNNVISSSTIIENEEVNEEITSTEILPAHPMSNPSSGNIRECGIILQRLDIKYIPSDDEDETFLIPTRNTKSPKRPTRSSARKPSRSYSVDEVVLEKNINCGIGCSMIPNLNIVKQEIIDDEVI